MSVAMRYLHMTAIAGMTILAAGCQSSPQCEDNAKILAEFKDIKARLDKIDVDLKKITEAKPTATIPRSNYADKKANLEALAQIKLPSNPTRDDIKDYIRKILLVSQGQNFLSADDPQVKMLAQVGEKNIDLLVDALKRGDTVMSNNYHIQQTINTMKLSNASKNIVINALQKNPELISAIVSNGWEKDAKDVIKYLLLNPHNGGYLSQEVIITAASLRNPAVNEALINFFINGSNRSNTYKIIRQTPEIKITDQIIDQAWGQALMGSDHDRNAMAAIAVGYGHKSALEALLTRNPQAIYGAEYNFSCDNAVRQSVDCPGSIADIKKWYDANRNNIVFDKADKKFKVKKTDAPATPTVKQ